MPSMAWSDLSPHRPDVETHSRSEFSDRGTACHTVASLSPGSVREHLFEAQWACSPYSGVPELTGWGLRGQSPGPGWGGLMPGELQPKQDTEQCAGAQNKQTVAQPCKQKPAMLLAPRTPGTLRVDALPGICVQIGGGRRPWFGRQFRPCLE